MFEKMERILKRERSFKKRSLPQQSKDFITGETLFIDYSVSNLRFCGLLPKVKKNIIHRYKVFFDQTKINFI